MFLLPVLRRPALVFLISLLLFFLSMDIVLYSRIQNQNLKELEKSSCDFYIPCHIQVKSLMMDHTTLYILNPLANVVEYIFSLHKLNFVSPNLISVLHVCIAIVGGKFLACSDLETRRMGVLLFELRTVFDALDGIVARKQRGDEESNVSDIGSKGWLIDGVCDGLGFIAMIVGCYLFLKQGNVRREETLPLDGVATSSKDQLIDTMYNKTIQGRRVIRTLLCFLIQHLFISLAWNRYISIYQELLQEKTESGRDATQLQEIFLKSAGTLTIMWLWRICNPLSEVQIILASLYFNKLWKVITFVQYAGFVVLFILVCITEIHIRDVQLIMSAFYGQDNFTKTTHRSYSTLEMQLLQNV